MNTVGRTVSRVLDLARISDRLAFLYFERCVLNRDSNALTAISAAGTVHVPAATVACVLVGPGTSVTHQAMNLLADSGTTIVWVGERGVRYYAHGAGLSTSNRLAEAQAAAVTNTRRRLDVARRMYAMRFPGEDVAGLTMHQLRGREGARMRACYRDQAERTGVPWAGRSYDVRDFESGDPINQALSAANHAMYGVCGAVIAALGCSPALGVVHTGTSRSLIYDLADLYKGELVIPLAFDLAADVAEGLIPAIDVASHARRRFRDLQLQSGLLTRCSDDLRNFFLPEDLTEERGDVLMLWDDKIGHVQGGVAYQEVAW